MIAGTEETKKGEAKKESKTVRVTLKVPKDLLERFDEVAKALGYRRTEAIKEAMRRFMDSAKRRSEADYIVEGLSFVARRMVEEALRPLLPTSVVGAVSLTYGKIVEERLRSLFQSQQEQEVAKCEQR
jgi:Ribbon-helix-helix protein, copG family.